MTFKAQVSQLRPGVHSREAINAHGIREACRFLEMVGDSFSEGMNCPRYYV